MAETAKIQTLRNNTTNEAIAPRTVISAVSGTGSEGQLVGFTGENALGLVTPEKTVTRESNKPITSGAVYNEIIKLATKTELTSYLPASKEEELVTKTELQTKLTDYLPLSEKSSFATKTDITNAVDNLQFGGRNYLVGTSTKKTYTVNTPSTTNKFQTFDPYTTPNKTKLIDLGFKVNDSVTFSFDWNITQTDSTVFTYGNFRAEWVGLVGSNDNQYIAAIKNPVDTFSANHISGHAEFTTTLTETVLQAHTFRLRFDNDVFTFNIFNCKMEAGNKATSWTPAPEDKQNVLTFDNVPTSGSNNPVKSSGIYNAINTAVTQAKYNPKVLTLTLSSSSWGAGPITQTVNATGVLASETAQLIIPTPAMSSLTMYYESGVKLTAQTADKLTFTAESKPTSNLTVYVAILPLGGPNDL